MHSCAIRAVLRSSRLSVQVKGEVLMPIRAPAVVGLDTPRLRLAPADASDTLEVFDLLWRNHEHFARWNPVIAREALSAESVLDLLASEAGAWQLGEVFRLWIRLREAPYTLIGWLKVDGLTAGAFHSGRLSYAIDEAHQRRGYMKEALGVAIDFFFSPKVHLHRLQASVLQDNEASIRVLRASGFEDIGVARAYLRVGGRWRDHLLMQRINSVWRPESAD